MIAQAVRAQTIAHGPTQIAHERHVPDPEERDGAH